MKTGFGRLIATIGVLTACILPMQEIFADSGGRQVSGESGCILREGASARFLRSSPLDKAAVAEAAIDAHRLRGARFVDPCLTGQLRHLPAAVYEALARRHPEKFAPLEDGSGVSVSPGSRDRGTHFGSGQEYHYVSLDDPAPPVPEGFLLFDPAALSDANVVYGTAYILRGEELLGYVASSRKGVLTLMHEGFGSTANESGTVGGFIYTDPENFLRQAALFRGKKMQLIPRLPGEIDSEVLLINDRGVALISSFDESFNNTIALYDGNNVTPLDFGPEIPVAFYLDMNNQGIISGTTIIDGNRNRGFRFDPHRGVATLLEPLPPDPHSWALGINNGGDILGYSFAFSATERVGVWSGIGKFKTYFVEGTPEFPTISNWLEFNDKDDIVISRVSNPPDERNNSYLVPKPGVRLNLADLVEDMPPEHGGLWFVRAINNRMSMIGDSLTPEFSAFSFLLERERRSTGWE